MENNTHTTIKQNFKNQTQPSTTATQQQTPFSKLTNTSSIFSIFTECPIWGVILESKSCNKIIKTQKHKN
jgi:hypothetical protein